MKRSDINKLYKFLGRSGLRISRINLGTMNFGELTNQTESFNIIAANSFSPSVVKATQRVVRANKR